jgi:hypothetical protein
MQGLYGTARLCRDPQEVHMLMAGLMPKAGKRPKAVLHSSNQTL